MSSLSGVFGLGEILSSNYGRQQRKVINPFQMVGEEKSKVGKCGGKKTHHQIEKETLLTKTRLMNDL